LSRYANASADFEERSIDALSRAREVPGQRRIVALDQIRALDKRRLMRPLGAVQKSTLSGALAALRTLFEG
jgi:mRNA-degrading endonuclease toxin of MazEF toxin-antitoxin module